MRQILKTFCIAAAIHSVLYFCDACTTHEDDDILHVKVGLQHSVELHSFNLSDQSYNLSVIFHLNISEGANITGFLYHFSDKGENAMDRSIPIPFPPGNFGEGAPQHVCTSVEKSIWTVLGNGTSVKCQVPCEGVMPQTCAFGGVCRYLKNDYASISRETRTVTLPVRFGRAYDLTVVAYNGWKVGTEFDGELDTTPMFCRHELMSNHGVDADAADAFCKHQIMDLNTHSTGPIFNFTQVDMYRDMSRNRGVAIFQWQEPRDIHANVTIKNYAINVPKNGKAENGKISSAHLLGGFYRVIVRDIVFGEDVKLKITPISNVSNCERCTVYGNWQFKMFRVPDIDACNGDSMTERYCDPIADCMDFPKESNTAAANCTCPAGYKGNGISVEFDEGQGCFDFDSCSEEGERNSTCVPVAVCTDIPPPSWGVTCACPPDYVGDGYRSGTGCTERALVIGLPLGILVPVIVVLAVMAILARCRRLKKEKLEKKVSHFLNGDITYTSAMAGNDVLNNRHATRGAGRGLLGEKWELDRDLIELKGIIGRGNFGVVQRATLKTDDGEVLVAVKMTLENPPESLRIAFLSEIAMIGSMGPHENLIGMVGCCTAGDESVYLVSKYMKYGDLLHFLWRSREERNREADPIYNLTELDIYQIASQVACGTKYLKEIKVIHGDLAARNILIGEGLECKISDFGLANDVYRYGMIKGAVEKTIPLKWVSPERMMQGKVPITWRSDVWSFGILLYEAVTLGASPYPDIARDNLFDTLKSGYRMRKPDHCSQYLFSIMMKCWEWVPGKRPSFKRLEEDLKLPYANPDSATYVNLAVVVPNLEAANEREMPAAGQANPENEHANAVNTEDGADLV